MSFQWGFSQNIQKIDSVQTLLLHSNNTKDSLRYLNLLSFYYPYVQPDSGVYYGQKALGIAQKLHLEKAIAQAYQNIGQNNFYQSNYAYALTHLLQALQLYKAMEQQKSVANVSCTLGLTYANLGDYATAIQYFLNALTVYEKENNLKNTSGVYNNMGIVYGEQHNYEKALYYFSKAAAGFEQLGNNNSYAGALLNMGEIHSSNHNYTKSQAYFFDALQQFKKTQNPYGIAAASQNLGISYLYKNTNFDIAERYIDTALTIAKQIHNQKFIAINYGSLGKLYKQKAIKYPNHKQQYLQKSITNLQTALPIFLELNNLDYYQEFTKELSECYKLSGDYKRAFETYQLHSLYKDSLFNDTKHKEFTRKEIQYEFKRKGDSIQLVTEKEIALKDATLKEKENETWFLIIAISLLTVIGGLLFYQNRLRKKKNQKLEAANNTKLRFFNILNHDLRSPVSKLLQLHYLQRDNPHFFEGKNKDELQLHSINATEHLLATMDDLLLWSKSQMEAFKIDSKQVVVQEVFDYLQKLDFSEKVTHQVLYVEASTTLTLYTDENFLKTILRNLTSNAMKATADVATPKIVWKAYKENQKHILTITDNGKGGTQDQFKALYDDTLVIGIKSGLGLHLVRDMAKAIGCEIHVATTPNQGTTISLIFQ